MRHALAILLLVSLRSTPAPAKVKGAEYYWYAVIGCQKVDKISVKEVTLDNHVITTFWQTATTDMHWFSISRAQKFAEEARGGSCVVMSWAEINKFQYDELVETGR